jgi:hypothetical protein
MWLKFKFHVLTRVGELLMCQAVCFITVTEWHRLNYSLLCHLKET